MKPWKSLSGIASWAMRLALVVFIYHRFFGIFMQFNLSAQGFWFAAGFIVFGLLLLIGGFTKNSLTVIAGLGLLILSVMQLVTGYQGFSGILVQWLIICSLSLYFLSNGNK